MASNQQLKEAEYIHRSEDAQLDDEVQVCGSLPCNYYEIRENGTENSYRYCNKHGIRVGYYDSCKYYDNSYYLGLISDYMRATIPEKESGHGEKENSPRAGKEKRKGSMWPKLLYILVALAGTYFLLYLSKGI